MEVPHCSTLICEFLDTRQEIAKHWQVSIGMSGYATRLSRPQVPTRCATIAPSHFWAFHHLPLTSL
jgi:hypothetical protein